MNVAAPVATNDSTAGWGPCAQALVVTDRAARVLWLSEAAACMARGEAAVRLQGGRLTARDTAQQPRLRAFIARCGECASPERLALPSPGGGLFTLRALPPAAATALCGAPGSVALVLHDAVHSGPSPAERARLAQGAYGWTPREADLIEHLLRELSLCAAAKAIDISPGHARQRLKSIFAKCGVSGQSQLIARLMSIA